MLKRKNPYLFRATGITNAPELIEGILTAHSTSSDETIFGEEFFEPIFKVITGAQIAGIRGVDFTIETGDSFQAISLKSGPNAFNSDQVLKLNSNFEDLERSLKATLRSVRKTFIPVMGCGYGKTNSPPSRKRKYYKLAGQAFWNEITGDPDFYLKLIELMRDKPDKHYEIFKSAWDRAVNRFVKQFSQDFCDDDGNIMWSKLVQYNSGNIKK